MFVGNDQFLRDGTVNMVAVPNPVDLSDRKRINGHIGVDSWGENKAEDRLNEYLIARQIKVNYQTFYPETSLRSYSEPPKNMYAVIEGRRNANLECFVLAFERSSLE